MISKLKYVVYAILVNSAVRYLFVRSQGNSNRVVLYLKFQNFH